jgi:hypothetical protein
LVDSDKRQEVFEYFRALVKAGYKVALSENAQSGLFSCGVTGNVNSKNRGYTLVIAHVQADVAVIAAWHVVFVVFDEGKWPVEESSTPNW